MKMKWYISTLILALTTFGIYQNKISSPNQEIFVQFNIDEVSSEQSQSAIANIKKQLHAFGIEVIQVNQNECGKLKIAYYSSVDVESIKKMLSQDGQLLFSHSSIDYNDKGLPKDKKQKQYNLDIYEIHQRADDSNDSAGTSVLIVKQDFDRFFNPNVFLPSALVSTSKSNRFVKEAFKVHSKIAEAIDTTSQNIQEVRAGPIFNKSSIA